MRERFYCLDCGMVGEMNVHGNCGTCNSGALVSTEAQRSEVRVVFQEFVDEKVERILAISGCK